MQLIPIDPDDRRTNRLLRRTAGAAIKELRECGTSMSASLESLGMAHPGTLAIGCVVFGEVRGVFALAPSAVGDFCSPVAPERLRTLARIISRLPPELRSAFENELRSIPRTDGSPVNFVTASEIAADDEARLAGESEPDEGEPGER
jgi:hypothetical protein